MASKKFKLTGFARFFFVMIFLAPLAYIGASYANGEDGIENIKNLFKGKFSSESGQVKSAETPSESTKTVDIPNPSSSSSNVDQAELDSKDEKIQKLIDSNIKLQEKLDRKTEELEDVKEQLETIKKALNQGSGN